MDEEASDLEIRLAGLESILGKSDDIHLHSTIPFDLGQDVGGSPDIIPFSGYSGSGILYVTCDLSGTEDQQPNDHGTYELAICHEEGIDWGIDLICKLAYYTHKATLRHGETMDISQATPDGSTISAFLFKHLGDFKVFGKPAGVLCCIGITESELDHAMNHGSDSLFSAIPRDYILTDTYRESYV